MAVRVRGVGSAEFRGQRSCRVEFRVEDTATGLVRRERKTFAVTSRTRAERERCKREFRAELERRGGSGGRSVTFGAYAADWLERRRADPALAAQTLRKDAYRLANINLHFADWRIGEIGRGDVRDFQLALMSDGGCGGARTVSGRPFSGTTANGVRRTLGQVMREAVRDGIIDRNPCDDLPAPVRDTKERVPLTPAEAGRFRGALDVEGPTHLTVAYRLCLFAGLRRGEACALRWRDFDADAGTIFVACSLCDLTHEFKATKTRAGRRVVPLDAATANYLRDFYRLQAPRLRDAGRNVGDACVTARPERDYLRPKDLSRSTVTFSRRHGFGHVTPHLLRHTYCTLLIAAGVDLKTVQHLMGHSDASTTLRVYAHYVGGSGERAAAALGELMASV